MAECASDMLGSIKKIQISGLLNCPICLGYYKKPRSLTCLHIFCEGCVDSVIREHADQWTRTMEIVCPVCRIVTKAPGNKPVKEWAKNLPINSALQISHVTGTENESDTSPACDLCAVDNEVKDAEAFCVQCNNYQCRQCVKAHSRFAVMTSHTVISLTDRKKAESSKLSLGKIEFCDLHPDKEIEFFCKEHDALCCYKCCTVQHQKCQTRAEVNDMGRQMKADKDQLLTKMTTVQRDIETIIQNIGSETAAVERQHDQIDQKLQKIRKDAIQKIDAIIDQARNQCSALRTYSVRNMSGQIDINKRLHAAIVTSNCLLKSVMDRGSDTQLFITYHKIEGQYKVYKKEVQREREGVVCAELSLEVGDVLTDVLKTSVYDTRVTVRKTYPKPLAGYRTENVALVDIPQREGLQTIPGIFGIDFLPSGLIVMVDVYNKQCCLLNTQYHTTSTVTLPAFPTDVTVVGGHEVAVAVREKSLIQLISTQGNTLTPTRAIACSRMPYRLSRVSDTEVAVGWWEAGVAIVSLQDGKEILYLDKDQGGREIKVEQHNFIAVDNSRSRFYHTTRKDKALFSFEYTGKPVFTFKSDNFGVPAGVAVDRDGNVCVCNNTDTKVYQVSHEGSLIRAIDVGVQRPCVICFDNNRGDLMAVVNNITKQIKKLSVVRFVP